MNCSATAGPSAVGCTAGGRGRDFAGRGNRRSGGRNGGRRGLQRRSRNRGHRGCLGGTRNGQRPPRIDPVGIGERTTSALGQAHVGPEDGRPLFTVSVVLDGESPKRVSRHDGVDDGGRLRSRMRRRRDREAGCRLGEQLHHRRWGARRSAADHSVSQVGTTELTEDQNGGDQGGHGAGADQMGAATSPTTTDLVDQADDGPKEEVGPGQPSQDGEEARPEPVRNRSAEGVRRLAATRDVVWERPANDGCEHDGYAHQPDEQDTEGADTAGDLATRRSGGSS